MKLSYLSYLLENLNYHTTVNFCGGLSKIQYSPVADPGILFICDVVLMFTC